MVYILPEDIQGRYGIGDRRAPAPCVQQRFRQKCATNRPPRLISPIDDDKYVKKSRNSGRKKLMKNIAGLSPLNLFMLGKHVSITSDQNIFE